MAISRRQFIKRAGIATAGGILGPSLLNNPFLQKALAQVIGDRYFVVIFLDGGNDGLNTVIPIDNGTSGALRTRYEAVRSSATSGGIQVLQAELTPTSLGNDPNTATPLGFHPGMIGLKNLYDLGDVAVIQGCGYPDPSLSHATSGNIWETSDPLETGLGGTGWLGRYLAANYGPLDIPGFVVRSTVPGEFQQTSTSVLSVSRLDRFGFPYDNYDLGDSTAKDTAFSSLYGSASGFALPIAKLLGDIGQVTLTATKTYPDLHDDYIADRAAWNTLYNTNQTSMKRDLREVAKVIYGVENGNVGSRFFQVRNGGYDTHSNQGNGTSGRHFDLHKEVGDAIELFYNDCADMGVANKLCVLVWSEFSRRVNQNDNGTDHGTQGPMLAIGGTVNGGIYGNHPDINTLNGNGNTIYSQNAADPYRSTDFRDVYGTVLRHWLNDADPSLILPEDTGEDPNLYWTAPDFDLPFLP